MERMKFLRKYYTEDGIKSLENRLKNLAKLYTKNIEYPKVFRMYGFPDLKIHSKAHLEGMLENMKEILSLNEIKLEVK